MVAVNENTLEQAIIAELQQKGYEYLYGPDIDRDYHEVILEDCFRSSMININPDITQEILSEAYKPIKNLGLLKLEELNASFHKFLVEGVPVPYQKDGESRTFTVKLIDFENVENNDFKVINQFTIIEYKTKRPDILIFINGIPMVLFELKNMVNEGTTIEQAYQQVKNYQLDMSAARWIQLEQITSEYGFISKHPTTGAAIASPFVSMAQAYNKQTQQLWYQIFQLVKENCSMPFAGTPQDDVMERLLSGCDY